MIALADVRAAGDLSLFGNDVWWLVILKAVAVFVLIMLLGMFNVWFERRVVGRMQHRIGPNVHGPQGLLQPLADGIKLSLKEEIVPRTADRVVYFVAPLISMTMAFVAFAVLPFGPEVHIFGQKTALQLTDLPVGVLIILAASSIGIYGIVLAGWSSGSTYPLLGALRSSAQMISYEVAMGLALVAVFLYAGSISTSQIVGAQASGATWHVGGASIALPSWYVIILFPSFVIYLIAMMGEVNRTPFDLPEAEGELVGGYQTEYSSMKFLMFYFAEYTNMVTVSALATTMFFGGWRAPWPLSLWSLANTGWLPLLWFLIKITLFVFFFVWVRGTVPRYRYDQFMRIGWKFLIPVALVWIMFVAGARATLNNDKRAEFLIGVAIALVLVVIGGIVADSVGSRRRAAEEAAEVAARTAGFDAFAGGFPVPPMPLPAPEPDDHAPAVGRGAHV